MHVFLLVCRTKWGRLLCWQGVVDMFLLVGVFRCVVDGAIMSFMGGLAAYHVTRLTTFSLGGLGVFLMGRPVVFPVARSVTFSVGGLGVKVCKSPHRS